LEDWLAKALQLFPELEDEILENGQSPMDLWIGLHFALVQAYEKRSSNDDLIGRIYDYAAWCFRQPEAEHAETDVLTAVAVCLIEHIPTDKKVADDLHRWMSTESFLGFGSLFRYFLSNEEFRTFCDGFIRKKKTYSGPSRI